MKVVHIPFSQRNPYHKLLATSLKKLGVDVKGASVSHFKSISFLNLSLFSLLVKHWKPDIVHLHWHSSFIVVDGSRFKSILKASIFMLQIICLKILRIKLVWTVHNLQKHEKTYRDHEIRFSQKLANKADCIIVHCSSAKQAVKKVFKLKESSKIAVIPHGNFLESYPNTINKRNAQEYIGIDKIGTTFLFLGELRYYKGIFELIDTFRKIDILGNQLIIAGRPHDRTIENEVLAKLDGINKNIHTYMDYVPDNDMQLYINAADVMVFPYRNIFTSGGIFLAMSFGKPIIAPMLGCISDTLRNSDNFLYSAQETDGLEKAIRSASAASNNDLVRIGLFNRNLAEHYNWRHISEKTLSNYKLIVSRS